MLRNDRRSALTVMVPWVALTLAGVPRSGHAYVFDQLEEQWQREYLATPIQVRGRVVDAAGSPLADVTLRLTAWGDNTVNHLATAQSGQNGYFAFCCLARRNALLQASLPGYYRELVPVALQRPQSEHLVQLGSVVLTAQQPGRARLTFAGDTMFGRRFLDADGDEILGEASDVLHLENLAADTAALFRFVVPALAADDYTTINLETPVTDEVREPHPTKPYVFFSFPESAAILPQVSVESVTLANNHIYDYLDDGLIDTVANLTEIGLSWCGAGVNDTNARENRWYESLNNLELAFQGFDRFVGYDYGGEELQVIARDDPAKGGALWFTPTRVEEFVHQERALGRLPILLVHGGSEYEPDQSDSMRELFDLAITEGAKLVVAHHPHVVQGIASKTGDGGPRFVFNSLGNFVFDQEVFETFPSYLAVVDLVATATEPRIERVRLLGLSLDGYVPRLLAGEALARLARQVAHLSTLHAPTANLRGAVVFAEVGQLVVAAEEADVLAHDTSVVRAVTLSGGQSGALDVTPAAGQATLAAVASDPAAQCRLGRDLLRVGSFEDSDVDDRFLEGDSWSLSENRYVQGRVTHLGTAAAVLLRDSTAVGRVSLWVANRMRVTPGDSLTVRGWLRADNAGPFEIAVRWLLSSGETLSSSVPFEHPAGDGDWTPFAVDLWVPSSAAFLKVYFRHYPPAVGEGRVYLDDLAIVRWEAVAADVGADAVTLATPNGWDHLRCTADTPALELRLTYRSYETPIGQVKP